MSILALEVALLVLGFWLHGLWFVAFFVVPAGFAMRNERRYRYGGSGKAVHRTAVKRADNYDMAWNLISGSVIAVVILVFILAGVASR